MYTYVYTYVYKYELNGRNNCVYVSIDLEKSQF